MKSAYEIAMERLEKASGPTKKLTDEQRAHIAEIDTKYESRIAETKVSYESKIVTAASPDEQEKLRIELTTSIAELEKERDNERDAVWGEK